MKKLFNRLAVAGAAVACCVGSAFAEGATSGVTSAIVTDYITDGKTQIIAVLTAGAAIVGAFFVWGLIKKALNRSK